MTLSLFLLRHGKSDWDAAGGSDHERPLKPRGRKAAARMGRLLTSSDSEPRLVLSSSALRARTTAEIAHETGAWSAPLEIVSGLYETHALGIIDVLRGLDTPHERVLVVGHEPACSETVALLTGGARPVYPTCALARIDLAARTWDRVEPGSGRLAWLIPPRALRSD